MKDIFDTPKESIFYEDKNLYAALAYSPLTIGHVVVVWKDDVRDLSKLDEENYSYLMNKVDEVRNVLKKFYSVDKVYLLYMDETQHVHWHLVPRYNQEGFNNLCHAPGKITDFADAEELRELFK